jgi:Fe2+ or Zn2+ uptake regulation protein
MARKSILAQEILKLLAEKHLLSAIEIDEHLKKYGKKFNKTSVYRALEKLQNQDLICKETFGESQAKYELRAKHHDHAVCTNCEQIKVVPCHNDEQRNIPGFKTNHHHTIIYGLCDSCSKRS